MFHLTANRKEGTSVILQTNKQTNEKSYAWKLCVCVRVRVIEWVGERRTVGLHRIPGYNILLWWNFLHNIQNFKLFILLYIFCSTQHCCPCFFLQWEPGKMRMMMMMMMRRRRRRSRKRRQEENEKEKEEGTEEGDARRKWSRLNSKYLSLTLRKLKINLHLTIMRVLKGQSCPYKQHEGT